MKVKNSKLLSHNKYRFDKDELHLLADGFKEIGSGLAVATIVLVVIEKRVIFSEIGVCILLFFAMWYTAVTISSQS